MAHLAFTGATAVLPDRLLNDAIVVCRDDMITYVGTSKSRIPKSASIVSLQGGLLAPGFVDIHIHGGGGADVMDGSLEAIHTVARSHLRHGTTTIFPTTSTAATDQLEAMLQLCKEARDNWVIHNGARVAGAHLYGPYFAAEKAGCHDKEQCRAPAREEYLRYFEQGIVSIATCAAELSGANEFYDDAADHVSLLTCGHSNSSWSEMAAAFEHGMRHVDHFWCAMSNVSSLRSRLGTPMQGSMLEYVLANEEMSTEVIADGMHLSAELLWFAWKMKGPERLCLVTDCNRALDMPPGKYRFGPNTDGAWFHSDGKVGRVGDSLASAVTGMDHMIRTMHQVANVPLVDTIRMATLTPAERTKTDDKLGSLEKGKQADLVVLSDDLKVQQVYINGQKNV